MRKIINLIVCLIASGPLLSQVAVNTDGSSPHNSAILELKSNNRGFLPPRMTWAQIQAISNPAEGLTVYDTGIKSLRMYNGNEWVVIGVKQYELTDPPGNFSTMATATGTGTGAGYEILMSPNKTIFVSGTYSGSIAISGTTLSPAVGFNDLFLAAFDSLSGLLWIKVITGTGNEFVNDMEFDQSGNLLLTGSFSGTVDLDPGPGVDNHSAVGASTDIFFAKYDVNGNILLGKHMGGSADENGQAILSDPSGNIYLAGNFLGTADFDPGPGTANLTPSGVSDAYLARYDINGNWIWSHRFGGTSFDNANDLEWVSGTILFGGNFNGTADFDPSVGVANLISAGSADVFFARYDINGGFLSAKRIGSTMEEQLGDLCADASGNYWAVGTYFGTCDMDPNAGTVNLVSSGGDNTFFARYDASGNLLVAKTIGSNGAGEGSSKLITDLAGNVYICSSFAGTSSQVDFDPGSSLVSVGSVGYDWYIAKYSSTGVFLWLANMGGTNYDIANAFAVSADGKFIVATGFLWSTTYLGFNRERIINSTQFYLGRYEE